MRVGSGVILFQLAGFLTSALADFYFAKHSHYQYKVNFVKMKPYLQDVIIEKQTGVSARKLFLNRTGLALHCAQEP